MTASSPWCPKAGVRQTSRSKFSRKRTTPATGKARSVSRTSAPPRPTRCCLRCHPTTRWSTRLARLPSTSRASRLHRHFLVRRHVIPYVFRERTGQSLTRVAGAAELLIFDLPDGQQVARGRSDEHLVGRLQIAGQQRLLFDPNPGSADLAEEHFARNPRQATGTERRSVHVA